MSRTRTDLAIANQRLAEENKRLRAALKTYVEDDERIYGGGHTERSKAGRLALRQGSRGPAVPSPSPTAAKSEG